MPLGDRYESQDCAIARSLEILGERWTLLILRDAFHGLGRFDEFQRSLGIATNTLASRLDKLVDADVLEPVGTDRAGRRQGYRLTERGLELHAVLLTLMAWGDRYLLGEDDSPVAVLHQGCGHRFRPTAACSECGEPVTVDRMTLAPGPGARTTDGRPSARTPPQAAAWGELAAT